MPLFEKLENESTKLAEKIASCPRCNGIMIKKRRKITCSTCGFRVQITSRYNDSVIYAMVLGEGCLAVGILVGALSVLAH